MALLNSISCNLFISTKSIILSSDIVSIILVGSRFFKTNWKFDSIKSNLYADIIGSIVALVFMELGITYPFTRSVPSEVSKSDSSNPARNNNSLTIEPTVTCVEEKPLALKT